VTGADGTQIERYYTFDPGSYLIRSGIRFGSGGLPFVRSSGGILVPVFDRPR